MLLSVSQYNKGKVNPEPKRPVTKMTQTKSQGSQWEDGNIKTQGVREYVERSSRGAVTLGYKLGYKVNLGGDGKIDIGVNATEKEIMADPKVHCPDMLNFKFEPKGLQIVTTFHENGTIDRSRTILETNVKQALLNQEFMGAKQPLTLDRAVSTKSALVIPPKEDLDPLNTVGSINTNGWVFLRPLHPTPIPDMANLDEKVRYVKELKPKFYDNDDKREVAVRARQIEEVKRIAFPLPIPHFKIPKPLATFSEAQASLAYKPTKNVEEPATAANHSFKYGRPVIKPSLKQFSSQPNKIHNPSVKRPSEPSFDNPSYKKQPVQSETLAQVTRAEPTESNPYLPNPFFVGDTYATARTPSIHSDQYDPCNPGMSTFDILDMPDTPSDISSLGSPTRGKPNP